MPLDRDAEFNRGRDAAITATRYWHEAQASQAMVLSRRTRVPKTLEHDAEVHRSGAEMMTTLLPEHETQAMLASVPAL